MPCIVGLSAVAVPGGPPVTASHISTEPERGEASQDSEFSGRSDYGAFLEVRIPAGDLFTGNVHALDVNSDAIATSVLTCAYDTSAVNDVRGKPAKSKGLFKTDR